VKACGELFERLGKRLVARKVRVRTRILEPFLKARGGLEVDAVLGKGREGHAAVDEAFEVGPEIAQLVEWAALSVGVVAEFFGEEYEPRGDAGEQGDVFWILFKN
jgi:hypothetical protein